MSVETPGRTLMWGACPECGDDLDLRRGQYGQFLGCSAYPQCDYSRRLDRAEENILRSEGYADRTGGDQA